MVIVAFVGAGDLDSPNNAGAFRFAAGRAVPVPYVLLYDTEK